MGGPCQESRTILGRPKSEGEEGERQSERYGAVGAGAGGMGMEGGNTPEVRKRMILKFRKRKKRSYRL